MKSILVIDDDADMCFLLSRFLIKNGFHVDIAYSGLKGIEKFKEQNFDIVLCDFRLGSKKDGKDVLVEIKNISPSTIVIIITGYSDIRIAVEVIKHGAHDYITKPIIPDEVLAILNNALNQSASEFALDIIEKPSKNIGRLNKEEFLLGTSNIIKELYNHVEILAGTNLSVILYGESGTGKEVIAKAIHKKSDRSDKPFVAMDCGTLSKELSGSELFGHMKGSFTGAVADKEGHFELANGGTLFLDEVANLTAEVQASLLRVIQERKLKRIGGIKEIDIDVRIIVASNENLQQAFLQGKFREDLYHRFNEFSIQIPALRDRKEDIPLFAEFFLKNTQIELNKELEGFEDGIMDMFFNYSWPGNLREFRNVIRRAVLLANSNKITAGSLPWEISKTLAPALSYEHTENFVKAPVTDIEALDLKGASIKAEYMMLMQVLKEVNFNKTKAALLLNIDRKTLYNKIRIMENMEKAKKGPLSI